jgi:RNA polymerase sigma-70 factor (ECF subfamily)
MQSFRPYVRVLVQAARRGRGLERQDDSDLIQDALLLAHRAFERFRGTTVAEFAGWLRQLAIRTVGHAARAARADKRTALREADAPDLDALPLPDGSAPDGAALLHERSAQIAAALEQLPDDMRNVVLGRFLDGLSYDELARRLQRTPGALRVLYLRALRKLREIL